MRLFDIDWSVALDASPRLELAVSQRAVEDEVLFNECEFAAGNYLSMLFQC